MMRRSVAPINKRVAIQSATRLSKSRAVNAPPGPVLSPDENELVDSHAGAMTPAPMTPAPMVQDAPALDALAVSIPSSFTTNS
jgi:hypothetical protein